MTVTVKVSVPLKLAVGVYDQAPVSALMEAVPFEGMVETVK